MIYLDYNATTPCAPEVVEAMQPYFGTVFGNPSSLHPFGAAAEKAVRRAAEQVAKLICAEPEQILFTGSATESNNHAIRNAPPGELLLTTAEHASLYEPARLRGSVRLVPPAPRSRR